MPIYVKVYNSDNVPKYLIEIAEEDQAKILTSEYIREVNKGITYRITSKEVSNYNASKTLTKKILR